MTRTFRLALASLGAAAALTACDSHWSPGSNDQFRAGFDNTPPPFHNSDVNRDSINYKQRVTAPTGEGSATAIATGTVQDKLNSAPAGNSATPQNASGTMGTVGEAAPSNANTDVQK